MDEHWQWFANRQGGHVTRAQLRSIGASDARISRAVGAGTLVRVRPGLYRDATPQSWLGDLWGRVLDAGPHAFAYRCAAAVVWELDAPADSPLEVAVARGRHTPRGARVHRLSTLRAGEVVRSSGLRVTSPVRTLLDLATIEDLLLLERAAESAIRRKLTSDAQIRAQSPPPRRGHDVWVQMTSERPVGAPATESDAETRFAQLCRAGGIPDPVRQHVVDLGRRFRLDFAWPELRCAVEIDGRAVHGPDALGPDLRRQNRIHLAGWLLLRFTYEDIVSYPDETLETLRRAFGLLALRG